MKNLLSFLRYFFFFVAFILGNCFIPYIYDGSPSERMLSAIIYFLLWMLLFLFAFYKGKSNRKLYITGVMLLFPAVFIKAQLQGFDTGSIGASQHIGGLLRTFVDLFKPSSNITKAGNVNFIFQLYSLLLGIGLVVALLNVKRFSKDSFSIYRKFKYHILILITLGTVYVLTLFKGSNIVHYEFYGAEWTKTILYLSIYFLLLFIGIGTKNKFAKRYPILILIFIFSFPVINTSFDFVNTIYADTVPSYENGMETTPLIFALPMTIKQLTVSSGPVIAHSNET